MIISLDNLIRKCEVIYVTADDSVHLIKSRRLNAIENLFCRYEIGSGGIVPVTSVENQSNATILDESTNLKSIPTNKTGVITSGPTINRSKYKRTSDDSFEINEHSPNKSSRSGFRDEKGTSSVGETGHNLDGSFKMESESPNSFEIHEHSPNESSRSGFRDEKGTSCVGETGHNLDGSFKMESESPNSFEIHEHSLNESSRSGFRDEKGTSSVCETGHNLDGSFKMESQSRNSFEIHEHSPNESSRSGFQDEKGTSCVSETGHNLDGSFKTESESPNSFEIHEHSPNESSRSGFRDEKGTSCVGEIGHNLDGFFKMKSESPNGASILNYSIIEQVPNDDDDILKLKLRLSKMQNCVVNLKRCDFARGNALTNLNNEPVTPSKMKDVKNLQTPCKSREGSGMKDDYDKMETGRTLRSKKKEAVCGTNPAVTPAIRKSTRVVKRVSYVDYISPVKSTSRRNRNNSIEEYGPSKICEESLSKTPKKQYSDCLRNKTARCEITPKNKTKNVRMQYSVRSPDKTEQCEFTPKSKTKNARNTPTVKARLVREGIITPSVQRRMTPLKKCTTPLDKARIQLHVSYIPRALPCREREFDDILNFLETKLSENYGGCMYISGVPGTGKTATVTEVIKKLQGAYSNLVVFSLGYVFLTSCYFVFTAQLCKCCSFQHYILYRVVYLFPFTFFPRAVPTTLPELHRTL